MQQTLFTVNTVHNFKMQIMRMLFALEIAILADPESRDPGISAVFANPESRNWQRLNPGISGLQTLAKIVLIYALNDRNNFFAVW